MTLHNKVICVNALLSHAIYLNAEFSAPWCIASPEATALAPIFGPGAGHVIIYHLLCEGRAYCEIEDGERVELSAGDLVALPHGHGHRMGSGDRVTPVDVGSALPGILARGLALASDDRAHNPEAYRGMSAGAFLGTTVPGRLSVTAPVKIVPREVKG